MWIACPDICVFNLIRHVSDHTEIQTDMVKLIALMPLK